MIKLQRRTLVLAAGVLLAAPRVLAQSKARVAILYISNRAAGGHLVDAFKTQMAAYGWVEGVNIDYVFREANGDLTRLDPLAVELVAEKPDLILATTDPVVKAVRKQTDKIPILFSLVSDPIGLGLVESLARPGGNATGTAATVSGADLTGKRLQLFKEAIPSLRRIALVYNPLDPADAKTLPAAQSAARELALEVYSFKVTRSEEIRELFAAMRRAKIEGALVSGVPASWIHRKLIANLMIEHRVPTITATQEGVEAGMLMSYSVNYAKLYRIGAGYANRILRGTGPAELPVEQPSVLELVVNLKTAKSLGVTIPPSILLRADRVIE